jgi:hypothetical protein
MALRRPSRRSAGWTTQQLFADAQHVNRTAHQQVDFEGIRHFGH